MLFVYRRNVDMEVAWTFKYIELEAKDKKEAYELVRRMNLGPGTLLVPDEAEVRGEKQITIGPGLQRNI